MILYIHIPFCLNRCGYCTFVSYENAQSLQENFVQALIKDLSLSKVSTPITSIFFGGGTPNLLSEKFYEKIFIAINKNFSLAQNCEITLEANPNLITSHWCNTLKNLGATRLSIGVQSFFDDKLHFLQRDHFYKDINQAISTAYDSGIKNLSIDLIYDTPQDTPLRIYEEIKKASMLPINHISAYSLSIEKNSSLQKQGFRQTSFSLHQEIISALKEFNFLQYEVSNYSRGYKVLHNLSYWRYEDYIGCGCGSVGKIDNTRFYTHTNLENYIKNPDFRKKELLSEEDIRTEKIFLGLRCEIGVDVSLLNPKKLQILLEEKKVVCKNGRVFALDYFIADELALWLL
ncbi:MULTISPECIES: radical SAM family heme chaperone HemW [unclassified Helicobacter]|uniref:radical SAM family heme chaperone HemW n=1 Tax=unclassified Helicobacter TaxID=2593540 RepID=UPI000CF185B9|nr:MULTISPECIES: radical SAM family heme chaperone HemW [unclassified Helicobacter]